MSDPTSPRGSDNAVRRSTHPQPQQPSTQGGDCVETATCTGSVHVRDSKDPAGPVLTFSAAWSAVVTYAAAEKSCG
ncbi:DUF397 domain-containing protein [Streptomyces sp. NPDC020917]|uniref:DUF397 domain-containing protein n=1 Tax=Streptomyces sp. NPDC020917 TaxID=3365102 RepID=UPI00378B1391